jgi:hypothetical protein
LAPTPPKPAANPYSALSGLLGGAATNITSALSPYYNSLAKLFGR